MINQNEITSSATKTLISLITVPVVGPALAEMFDFRAKLKQNRLNQFTELLENYFSNHQGISLESFQTADFSDLFESVLKRVAVTSSTEKMRMFKDILVNQLENPSQAIDESEIYLNLITELTEIEIKILFEYRQFIKQFQPQINELRKLEHALDILVNKSDSSSSTVDAALLDLETKIGNKRVALDTLQNIYNHRHFGITQDQFLFCKQRLFSKALLVDNGIGAIQTMAFQIMGITQFGIKFVDYILIHQ